MRAHIVHRLTYCYDAPITLGEHRLCLKPRGHGFQRLLDHSLSVLPEPCQRRELLAASGDEILRLGFLGSTDQLCFEANSRVETRPAPPLDSCFNGMEPPLPYPRGQLNQDLLGALEGWLPNGQHEPSAIDLTQEALMGSNQQTLAFLNQLIELIQDRVKYTQRHAGPAWPAGRTLRERIGSCRDLAMLMVTCCRVVGLPARFVSGYQLLDPAPEQYDLHAWAEVYLPGAGWRGFDPSAGSEVNERYVVLATSSKPELTAAVSGSFSGPANTSSDLSWSISVDEEPANTSAPKQTLQAA
ncbi:transglutaminase family protein [Synechococcus sp. RS9916]|uniref:transglutaminase family protein n=1 Tax=Synechococcus sp. RS9916 TaxID=221359 RepID=UPI0000E53653|nr:transglutaminase family protein [Synechococcus sp. RS9916]EAU75274.1 Transglutaminase-like protein [Synechococcus sp. RS9916]